MIAFLILEVRIEHAQSEARRRRMHEGRPVRYLLPEGVARYIEKNGLYT